MLTGLMRRFDLRRLAGRLTLLGLRAGMTGSKFLLALYTARYLSLADLGIYGLLVGGTTIVPAIAGLGMTDFIVRKIVDRPAEEALPLIASRQALTLAIHLVVQPLVFAVVLATGAAPLRFVLLAGAILLLENLGTEANDMLIARRRVFLANWLGFLRQGLWPLPVIAIGLLDPAARTLNALLMGWLAALALAWAILIGLLISGGRWRYATPQWRWIRQALPGSLVLYVKDVSGTVSSFIDRFLISFFLGLDLTGVYTLFWSIGNVVHSLAVFGVLQTHIAPLVGAGQAHDAAAFRTLERRLQVETGTWALLIAAAVGAATPLMVRFLERPLLSANLAIFWLVLAATLMRIAADGYGFALYALHRDRAIATIALAGAVASATLNTVLTPLAGLWGSSAAYLLTGSALFAARYWTARQALAAKPAAEPAHLPRP